MFAPILHVPVLARLRVASVRSADTHTVTVVGNDFATFCDVEHSDSQR